MRRSRNAARPRRGGLYGWPRLPRRGSQTLPAFGVAVLTLLGAAGSARADEPTNPTATLGLPIAALTAQAPATAPAPPANAAPEAVWENILNLHATYVENKGGLPPWLIPPPPPAPLHFFAEAGFYMVHTSFDHNPAYLVSRHQGSGSKAQVLTQAGNFDYPVNFGPRITLGVVGNDGLGLRASWWLLDEATHLPIFPGGNASLATTYTSAVVPDVPGIASPSVVALQTKVFGDKLAFNNSVRLQVYDWEAFKQFQGEAWCLLLSGGARYGNLSQSYQGFRFNSGSAKSGTTTVNVLEDSDYLTSGRNFAGVGPTAAAEFRQGLGFWGLSLYGTARGSVLFGQGHFQAFQQTVLNEQTSVGTAAPTAIKSSALRQGLVGEDGAIPMADFEVGVDCRFKYGGALLFAKAGLVDQTWFGAGSATSGGGDLGFLGLRLTAGVSY